MKDEQHKAMSSPVPAEEKFNGIPDNSTDLKESVDSTDKRAKDSGEGDRTDAPDMYDLDNNSEK
ncbi:MAG: hypothetical protein JWP88_2218 [Flaviaesturariibacter sp.]|nr:hypothetical protein [Flaviaesturariibacter sp.]